MGERFWPIGAEKACFSGTDAFVFFHDFRCICTETLSRAALSAGNAVLPVITVFLVILVIHEMYASSHNNYGNQLPHTVPEDSSGFSGLP